LGRWDAPLVLLIRKRAPIGPIQEDYDVLAEGAIVGRIFLSPAAPEATPELQPCPNCNVPPARPTRSGCGKYE
jgi:hypothetical protein